MSFPDFSMGGVSIKEKLKSKHRSVCAVKQGGCAGATSW